MCLRTSSIGPRSGSISPYCPSRPHPNPSPIGEGLWSDRPFPPLLQERGWGEVERAIRPNFVPRRKLSHYAPEDPTYYTSYTGRRTGRGRGRRFETATRDSARGLSSAIS